MNTAKNYMTDGGDKWVIGGTLEFSDGSSVTGMTTAEIVDVLTSDDATKALSAKQGKALKTLVDAKYTAADATAAVAGLVKMAANLAASAEATSPTTAEFNALLATLKAAGLMVADA